MENPPLEMRALLELLCHQQFNQNLRLSVAATC